MKKVNVLMTAILLLGMFSPLVAHASESVSDTMEQAPMEVANGPLLLYLNTEQVRLQVGQDFNPESYINLAMNNEGQVTLSDNKGLSVSNSVNMQSAGMYTVIYRLENTLDTSQYVEKILTVYVEDILELAYTEKANNGQVTLQYGQDFNPAEYVMAWKNGIDVPLTDLGFGPNGQFLGFTVEGDEVDTTRPGIYTLLYILRGGSPSSEQDIVKELTVRVEDNLEMEVVNPITLYAGQSFNPADYAKAWRNGVEIGFGDFGPNGEYWGFIDNGDNLDINTPGTYWITYRLHGTLAQHVLDKTVDVHVILPKVTIEYVDEEGNKLAPSQQLEGKVGDSYTSEQLVVSGYSYKSLEGSATGNFIAGDQTVTYTYTKDAIPVVGKVIVEYTDKEGNSLMPKQTVMGEMGTPYQTEQLTIQGYTFETVNGNPEGAFTSSEQVVTYIYSKTSSIPNPGPLPGQIPNPNPGIGGGVGGKVPVNSVVSSGGYRTPNASNTGKAYLPKMGASTNLTMVLSLLGMLLMVIVSSLYMKKAAKKG